MYYFNYYMCVFASALLTIIAKKKKQTLILLNYARIKLAKELTDGQNMNKLALNMIYTSNKKKLNKTKVLIIVTKASE